MIPHFFLPEKKSFYIVIPNTDQDEVKKKKKKAFPDIADCCIKCFNLWDSNLIICVKRI